MEAATHHDADARTWRPSTEPIYSQAEKAPKVAWFDRCGGARATSEWERSPRAELHLRHTRSRPPSQRRHASSQPRLRQDGARSPRHGEPPRLRCHASKLPAHRRDESPRLRGSGPGSRCRHEHGHRIRDHKDGNFARRMERDYRGHTQRSAGSAENTAGPRRRAGPPHTRSTMQASQTNCGV